MALSSVPTEARLSLVRIVVGVFVAAHLVIAIGWLWFMPGGFPWDHPRLWANRILPAATVAVLTFAVIGAARGRPALFQTAPFALACGWTALAVTWVVVFPASSRRVLIAGGLASAIAWLVTFLASRGQASRPWVCVLMAIGAVCFAVLFTRAQIAPSPDTVPLALAMPADLKGEAAQQLRPSIQLSSRVLVLPGGGEIDVAQGDVQIGVRPLLTFISQSPDRCWTNLARPQARNGRPWRATSLVNSSQGMAIEYQGDERGRIEIERSENDALTTIEAWTELPRAVYSHLNTFCELEISGHRKLSLVFSPCGDVPIEVLPAGYPIGRPARLAYLDGGHTLRVVEARSGEKGPFRELASGPLDDEQPLAITIVADGRAVFRVTVYDWAPQAGTQLSPTAGWGLPVNAIEFQESDGGDVSGYASIWFTLAGTSVGRGWDSVGHRPGVYRNRLTIESLASGEPAR